MERKWNEVLLSRLMICLIAGMWSLSASSLQEEALFVQHTVNGPIIIQRQGIPHTNSVRMLQDPAVVWSHYLTSAIYNTTSNTVGGHVFAGTYLNPPKEAELFASGGGGAPEWGYSGTEFYTDAGDNTFTLAAVDEDASGVTVIKWTGPDPYDDWTTSFAGYSVSSYGPIAVSDDGSTIAAIAAPPGTDAHLLLFDADSATPLIDYVASGLGFPRYVRINSDGRYTAFIALATIVVFDRDLLSVRGQISMGYSNDAMDISGDGNLIAYAWPTLQVMEWTGSSYQNLWAYNPGASYYASTIAISNDGTTIVSCWYTLSFNTLKVVVHDVGSATPLWTYDYPFSSGVYQEDPMDVDITDDGKYFIVGSLGDDANLNPEVHIFRRDSTPYVYYTVDMPGSMFSVDISSDGSYATACGKHVHANVMGSGGDVVMINTDITGIADSDLANIAAVSLIDIHPNPFSQQTDIRFQIADNSGGVALKIFDASGRVVKFLNIPSSDIGHQSSVVWDGRDEHNRMLGSGVYFVHLENANHREIEKVVLLK